MYLSPRPAVTKYHGLGNSTADICSLTALEAGSPRSRCQQVCSQLPAEEEGGREQSKMREGRNLGSGIHRFCYSWKRITRSRPPSKGAGTGHSEEHDCQESGIIGHHCGHRYPVAKLRRRLSLFNPHHLETITGVSILGNSQTLF